MKYLAILLSTILIGVSTVGCGNYKRKHYVTESVSPVLTYSVTFVDNFSEEDRQELLNSVAAIFSQALASVQPTVINNINDIDITITITKNKVGPVINHSHNNILTECGDRGHRLPHLFEQLCKKWKNKKGKKGK